MTATGTAGRRNQAGTRCWRCLGARSIVLVGLMGAGKTAIGRRLATRARPALRRQRPRDRDGRGMTIPDIFERYGEAEFRAASSASSRALLEDGPQVLATGGGAFMNAADARARSPSTASRSGSRPISTC